MLLICTDYAEYLKRWTAPEVLNDPSRLSLKSDVYSFGIVMWEVAQASITEGKLRREWIRPKRETGCPNTCTENVLSLLRCSLVSLYLLMIVTSLQDEPYETNPTVVVRTRIYECLPDKYGDLMTRCLNEDTDLRPDFTSIVRDLSEMINNYDY